ncbi:MAG TPA: LysR family transcriptional regulator [Hyphomicrobiaceae bacterium]|nr:LysR family transcriptional regulator [Hyphomicrobiaceae bacterium]
MPGSVRDLTLFVAVYEQRSFTAAAEREGATQSGVSQHIRKLEDTLGVRLFTRSKGEVQPTPAGDALYLKSIDILRLYDAAKQAVRSYGKGLEGPLVVGLMPTMTRSVLAPALARFVADNPNVSINVIEAYSATLTQQVRAAEIDFAIVPAFACPPGLSSRLFLRTPEVLVSNPSSGLAHGAPVRLAGLSPVKLVLPGRGNTRRHTLETYCAANGVSIERLIELDAMLATLDLVARSDWMTVLPGIMMALDDGTQHRVNPLAEPPFWLDLVLIEPSHRSMTTAALAFLAALEAEAQRLNLRWSEPDGAARAEHTPRRLGLTRRRPARRPRAGAS